MEAGDFMENISKIKVISVVGYTASGKTEMAVHLADKFSGEVISADSRQIYKEMDIGTAKPDGRWQGDVYIYKNIVHYLIDEKFPSEDYSVSEFKQRSEDLIVDIVSRGKLPILVGGTGQYITALIDNWKIPPQVPDKIRDKYQKLYEEKGKEYLWQMLKEKDPQAAEFVQKDNIRRLIRALEVIEATGEKFSSLRRKEDSRFRFLLIGIDINRDELYRRIDKRVDEMIDRGLVDEVRRLIDRYGRVKSFQTIGYQEIIDYLDGETDLKTAVDKIKTNTHRFVRHQMNWFKKMDIKWIKDKEKAEKEVENFLSLKEN